MLLFVRGDRCSNLLSGVNLVFVVFCFLDDHIVKCLKPGEETSTIRNDFSHDFVKRLATIIGFMLASKNWESFRPYLQNPEFFHVVVVKIQHQVSVSFLFDLQLDVIFNTTHLRNNFVNRQKREAKVSPQQYFGNSMISVESSKIVLC